MQQAPTSISIPDLRAAVNGRVISPEDPDYEATRTVLVPAAAERRPAAVVRVADARTHRMHRRSRDESPPVRRSYIRQLHLPVHAT